MKLLESHINWRAFPFSVVLISLCCSIALSADSLEADPGNEDLLAGKSFIYHLRPEKRGGKAYKLVYFVGVPIEVFWRFKTDFDNDFLLTNKYIKEHRFLRRDKNTVVTENKYSTAPNATFRWRTTLYPSDYRMNFVLENPEECGQKFHYGSIQLRVLGQYTKVTQIAHFDFFGASLWANYPWRGGMTEFLSYTARWEQDTILRLKGQYVGETD